MQPQAGFEQLKQAMRAAWMAGDFGKIAQYSEKAAEEFVARTGVRSGAKVLDVACGTGNLAIPAARAAANVTGVDIAPNLLEQARQRASQENLEVAFDEGDAEQLPYADKQFDVVMTMFGAMFAPRPERVATELVRVCRPGGTIAMANWTRDGYVGKMFAINAQFVPPPQGIPSPLLWGDEPTVRERLSGSASGITTTRQTVSLELPFPPGEVVQLFREYFGPTRVAFSKLDAQRQAEFASALEKLLRDHNEARGDETRVRAEYLEVIATRA